VDLTAAMQAPCPPEALFAWVDDLSRYPSWLGIVERAGPEAPAADGEVAWTVDLPGKWKFLIEVLLSQGSLGPSARRARRLGKTGPT